MDRQAWLDQVVEETLEPALPICDPHHHLWDYPEGRYLLDELLADVGSGHRVVSTVFMECGSMYRADGPEAYKPVGETEFVNGIAAISASGRYGEGRACAAIVGYADLNLGARVGEVLDRHAAASTRFRGIRHAAGWDAHDEIRNSHTAPVQGMLGDATFREGFAELGKRGMTFDGWLYHPQIAELTDLARAFPDQPIVFDHFGGPLGIGPYAGRRAEIYDHWKGAVAELAQCENVVAKLGGLVMAINGFGFHKRERPATSVELVEATRDYHLHMIDCFGVDRCMFESNFPVDRVSCSYNVLWNSFKRLAAGFSASDKAALFHDTAVRVYRPET
ncbi:MAG: amidohydrolase family protein [Pseudomonadales bacterium]|nr:amidohydrolase family protein [Pseudomonadales bacterium]